MTASGPLRSPLRPGPKNLLTDVPGLRVGQASDVAARTGVTVVLPDAPAVAAVDQRGGGPGTRETDLLDPANTVQAVHAVVLSGGSAFGLDAAGGVAAWLAARGVGFPVGPARVPIVPGAVLFDLLSGGRTDWGETPPHRELGRQAVAAARGDVAMGNVGAGTGARAGALKGGIGSASLLLPGPPEGDAGPITVAALVAVNSLGSPTIGETPAFWAWPWAVADEMGPLARPGPDDPTPGPTDHDFAVPARANTTLAVVATDLALSKAQARRVAIMAQDGLARAIRPVHAALDGDTVFALSTGRIALESQGEPAAAISRCGMAAADCLARAVARALYHADTLGDIPGYRDRFGLP